MAAQDNLQPAQFQERELVPYPRQLGLPGKMRLGWARVRTLTMSPMNAGQYAREHGLDPSRVAYGKDSRVTLPGHIAATGPLRSELPKETRGGW